LTLAQGDLEQRFTATGFGRFAASILQVNAVSEITGEVASRHVQPRTLDGDGFGTVLTLRGAGAGCAPGVS
jgi:hypothetical protein